MTATEGKKPKPRWWIPYWLIQIVLAIVFWVAIFYFLNFSFLVASIGLTFTLVFIGVLYYVRAKKSNWLKPYWIILTVSVIVIGVVSVLFFNVPLERAFPATVLTVLATGFGYYMRVRPNIKLNRSMYVGLGVFVLGFVLWFFLMISLNATGIRRLIDQAIPDGILALITLILCYVAGGFIGDWIGKRRDYRLPLYP
jgi:drug/metabolite transporter (DMT)-like permease